MKKLPFILLSILLISILYFFTISNTIFGGDSGDLVSAIITNGLAHPPGYPLYTIIGLFMKNIPLNFLSAAGKVTLTSTFSTIFSLVLIYLIIKEIADKKYFSKFLLVITLLISGFNYLIWLYTIVPEVFLLNSLIVLSILYSSIKFYKTTKHKYLYLTALFIGLGISHHHTFVLILPSVLYLLYKKRKEFFSKLKKIPLIASFMLGISPLLYMILIAFQNPAVIWGNTNTVYGFFATLLRFRYGTFVAAPSILSSPQYRFSQLTNLLTFIQDDFSLIGLILFAFCLIFYFRLKKSPLKIMLTAILINIIFFGPFFVFYANFPLINAYYFATIERFFITFYFFFGITIYFGLVYFVENILKNIIKNYVFNPYLKKFTLFITLTLLIIYPIGLLIKNFPIIYALKNDRTAENLGSDIIDNLPNNSILFVSSDNFSFISQYVYYNQIKPTSDKVFIHLGKFGFYDYMSTLKSHYPKLRYKPLKNESDPVQSIILANKDQMQIYSEVPLSLKNLKDYEWIPQGIMFKLEKKDKINKDEIIKSFTKFWANSLNKDLVNQMKKDNLKFKNLFTSDIPKVYSSMHKNTALYLMNNNKIDEALTHINDVRALEKYDPVADTQRFVSMYYEKKGDCVRAEKEVESGLSQLVSMQMLQQLNHVGLNCFKSDNDKKRIGEKIKQYMLKQNLPLDKF